MGMIDKLKEFFQGTSTTTVREVQVFETYQSAGYNAISTISRCIDLILDTAATIDFKLMEDTDNVDVPVKFRAFEKLLETPDPDYGKFDFRRDSYKDLLFSGNCFLYNIGNQIQKLENVEFSDQNVPYTGEKPLEHNRLMHVRLLPEQGTRYGQSYFKRIDTELDLIDKMLAFSYNYFRNNGLPGAILETEDPLSKDQKERIIEEFINYYAMSRGNNSKPFVADRNLKFREIQHSLKDLQFQEGIGNIASRICGGLGVPEVLINSGNNANLSNNYKLFIFTTVYPLVLNMCSQLTLHLRKFYRNTGKYKVVPVLDNLPYLQEDMINRTNSTKTLVTTGILTINEGRTALKYPVSDNSLCDEHLIPQNITGAHFEPSPGVPSGGED